MFSRVSFELAAGGLLAVTGPNGSGKSSLLRVLAGLLRAESGTVSLDGLGDDTPALHYLGHADALKPMLTLRETLAFWAALHRVGAPALGLAEIANRVGLLHALDLPVRVLSAGQRRRAGLARLLLAPRRLWLLDEPTAALDREGEQLLAELMRTQLAAGGMVVAATHGDLPLAPHATLNMAAGA